MTRDELAKPDNEADRTILLEISGNRLVSILNALDQSLHQLNLYRFEGDKVVGRSPWYDGLHETTEAVRDELSRQRCQKVKGTIEPNGTSPHPIYTVADWQYEVANGDTRRGYSEWVASKIEEGEG